MNNLYFIIKDIKSIYNKIIKVFVIKNSNINIIIFTHVFHGVHLKILQL